MSGQEAGGKVGLDKAQRTRDAGQGLARGVLPRLLSARCRLSRDKMALTHSSFSCLAQGVGPWHIDPVMFFTRHRTVGSVTDGRTHTLQPSALASAWVTRTIAHRNEHGTKRSHHNRS